MTRMDCAPGTAGSSRCGRALRSQEIRFLDVAPADRVLAYLRPGAAREDDILVLLNWSEAALDVRLPAVELGGNIRDLVSGQSLSRNRALAIPGYGVRILTVR
jgi:hypothetical protein